MSLVRPGKVLSAKEHGNLRPGSTNGNGGGRRKSTPLQDEARKICRKLVTDAYYKRKLINRLREGTIQPGMEAMLWYYAYGQPKPMVESHTAVAVKIVFETREEPNVLTVQAATASDAGA